jgi:NAD(P)-dependent dehydrogenase (short-subunit alcohol dehydrogenase family)
MNLQDETRVHDFTGRTAVVTGGAGILGGEMACALVGCGANVAVLDLNPPPAPLADRLQQGLGQTMFIQASVLNRADLTAAEDMIAAKFGPIHMLLNVAGGHQPAAITTPDLSFFDLTEEGLRSVFDLNLMGTILPTQIFARRMAELGEGAILNISSASSFHSMTRVPAYSAAKAAINNFTQWLAVHLAQEYSPRLRVNAIAPGFYLTHTNRSLLTEVETGDLTERGRTIIDHTPMGRLGNPDELLSTMLWLLSPASSFVTGVIVPVDGGFTAFSGV